MTQSALGVEIEDANALMAEYKGTDPADFNKVLSLANARMQRDPLPPTSALRIITKWLDTKKPQTLNSTLGERSRWEAMLGHCLRKLLLRAYSYKDPQMRRAVVQGAYEWMQQRIHNGMVGEETQAAVMTSLERQRMMDRETQALAESARRTRPASAAPAASKESAEERRRRYMRRLERKLAKSSSGDLVAPLVGTAEEEGDDGRQDYTRSTLHVQSVRSLAHSRLATQQILEARDQPSRFVQRLRSSATDLRPHESVSALAASSSLRPATAGQRDAAADAVASATGVSLGAGTRRRPASAGVAGARRPQIAGWGGPHMGRPRGGEFVGAAPSAAHLHRQRQAVARMFSAATAKPEPPLLHGYSRRNLHSAHTSRVRRRVEVERKRIAEEEAAARAERGRLIARARRLQQASSQDGKKEVASADGAEEAAEGEGSTAAPAVRARVQNSGRASGRSHPSRSPPLWALRGAGQRQRGGPTISADDAPDVRDLLRPGWREREAEREAAGGRQTRPGSARAAGWSAKPLARSVRPASAAAALRAPADVENAWMAEAAARGNPYAGLSNRLSATDAMRVRAEASGLRARMVSAQRDSRTPFMHYAPSTEAERAMNRLWLAKRAQEVTDRQNAEAVRTAVEDWQERKSVREEQFRARQALRRAVPLDELVDSPSPRLPSRPASPLRPRSPPPRPGSALRARKEAALSPPPAAPQQRVAPRHEAPPAPWDALPRYPRLRYAAPRAKSTKSPAKGRRGSPGQAAPVESKGAGLVDEDQGNDNGSDPGEGAPSPAVASSDDEPADSESGTTPRVVWQPSSEGTQTWQRGAGRADSVSLHDGSAAQSRWGESAALHLPAGLAEQTSANALEQAHTDEMDRIKAAFARKGLTIDPTVLERAYAVHRDVPHEVAAKNLPNPGTELVPNPIPKEPKKGAKKGKKGAKKGGKRKKKK